MLKNVKGRVVGDAIISPACGPCVKEKEIVMRPSTCLAGLVLRRKIMDASLEKLKNRIESLTAQQRQIEERYIGSIAKLVAETTRKGFDMRVLTGIILDACDIVAESPAKREAWRVAGQKFLFRAKNQYSRSKGPQRKEEAANV